MFSFLISSSTLSIDLDLDHPGSLLSIGLFYINVSHIISLNSLNMAYSSQSIYLNLWQYPELHKDDTAFYCIVAAILLYHVWGHIFS